MSTLLGLTEFSDVLITIYWCLHNSVDLGLKTIVLQWYPNVALINESRISFIVYLLCVSVILVVFFKGALQLKGTH